ncbi:MAG: multidrug ABC transporter permease [Chlorobiaceae bacterium]|nr:multidrug ABC transporter permease [Chlorobiaceae bacterium]MBA4310845.1 multidrug ABC transporter permease [Chlorobiaceae bacterium]
MKQFLIFTKKEFYHIFRDRWTTLILLVLPILMIILFGFGITTEIKNTKFAVYDPSRDVASQGIINKFSTSEYFTLSEYLDSPEQIEKLFQKGKIGLVIVFSEKFHENILHTGEAQVQLILDGTDPNTALTLTNYATQIINLYQQEQKESKNILYQIKSEIKLLYNPTLKGEYNTVPGVMGMVLMLICAMMTSVSIAREKELGTMEVLLVSPMKPIIIILSKVVPYFFLSLINLTTILLLSVFVLKVPIVGSLWLLIFVSLIFIFVALALGLLISSVVEKQMVALLISGMALMMPIILLSGLMFPIENMPIVLQWISNIIPAKWFIIAVKNVMIKGLGIASIINEIIILTSMAVILTAISLKKFKTRLE